MCGIAGIFGDSAVSKPVLSRMAASLAHRGPDDIGTWSDAEARVGLVHRRLSIVDLSPAGHQPMLSSDTRFVLSYNGEIYNHGEIRRELEAAGLTPAGGWRGHSDTETLVEAILNWGLEDAVRRCVGMFAFALWDRQTRELHLVRDRFGEKPLYYGWAGRDFVFGSELKALRRHPSFANPINRQALRLFAARGYVPAPLSIYERIFKLQPGSIITLDTTADCHPLDEAPEESTSAGIRIRRYWSYHDVVLGGLSDPITDESEAVRELEAALTRSVAGQAMADVPVGMFLSGGIDSSTIAALYQKVSSRPIETFSIGFESAGYNEAPYARQIAERLGSVHHEQIVTGKDAMDVIPLLPSMYDEPFGDSSQIPTFLVSRMARSRVTVALSGDGGDELFGGYRRHFAAPRLWRKLNRVPRPLRSTASRALRQLPAGAWTGIAGLLARHQGLHASGKIQKGLRLAGEAIAFDDVYGALLDQWSFEPSPVLGSNGSGAEWGTLDDAQASDEVRAMYWDAMSYLPDDILCKVDRASMAVSLESRVPFLDHRVAELAARIPVSAKIAGGEGKKVLREVLYRHLPKSLFDRPKAGFAIPVADWLRGPLRDWAESLLDSRRVAQEGWFDPAMVTARWRDELSGRRDSPAAVWSLLMFQAWLNEEQGTSNDRRAEVAELQMS